MRVERHDPSAGCLILSKGGKWLVVAPNGKVLCVMPSEYEARNEAQYRNLTATPEELEEWRS